MSLSLLLTQKDQIHCPYCYRKVKHWGSLACHIRWSLACQVKHDNDNPQLPRTSHDPVLTPNHHNTPPGCHDTPLGCHNTPPGTGWHDPDGSETQVPLWVLDILRNLRPMILTVEHLHQPHI